MAHDAPPYSTNAINHIDDADGAPYDPNNPAYTGYIDDAPIPPHDPNRPNHDEWDEAALIAEYEEMEGIRREYDNRHATSQPRRRSKKQGTVIVPASRDKDEAAMVSISDAGNLSTVVQQIYNGRFAAPPASVLLATWPPKRDWVIRSVCMTSAVALLVGIAGVGKTICAIQAACTVAAGTSFFGLDVPVARSVIIVSGEENLDEIKRRMMACVQKMCLDAEALDRIYIIAGQPFLLGGDQPQSECRATVVTELVDVIRHTGAGLVVIDPLVEVHDVDENSNDGMRKVIADLRTIAERGKCAVLVVHHAGKGSGGAGDQNLSRGASSVVGAVRSMVTLVPLGEKEAQHYGIRVEDAGDYVRLDGAKSNYARLGGTIILKKQSVPLPNGDDVGVLVEAELAEIEDRSAGEPDLRQIAQAAAQAIDTAISVNKLSGALASQNPDLFPGITCADPSKPSEALRKLVVQAVQAYPNGDGWSLNVFTRDGQGGNGKVTLVEKVPLTTDEAISGDT